MSLLDFFRRKDKSKKPTKFTKDLDISISTSDEFLRIWSIDFFGPFAKSPNDKYIVGWQDFDYRGGSRGGDRESGFGRVILIRDNQILYQVDMERPNDGSVANNGRVAINDWRFGLNLDGIFYVIEKEGSKLIEHLTKANLYTCGISEDGQLAWCNSTSSEDENESDKLFIFSTSPPKLLFKMDGRDTPEKIEKAENEILIRLKGFDRRYTINGELINAEEVRNAEKAYIMEHGSGYDLFYLSEKILKEKGDKDHLSEEQFHEVRNLLLRALEKDISDWHKAKIHRHLGKLAEEKNNQVEAFKQYTLAIEYDPKVGVKKALAKLESALKPKKNEVAKSKK